MNTPKIKVFFKLDGKREGEGIIPINANSEGGVFIVTLTEPCKEFKAGENIMVDLKEIYHSVTIL